MDPTKRRLKKEARELEVRIRAVVLAWNPIGVSVPPDEYDCLVHKIANSLLHGQSQRQTQKLITRELTEHFGLAASPDGINAVVRQIAGLSGVSRQRVPTEPDAKQG